MSSLPVSKATVLAKFYRVVGGQPSAVATGGLTPQPCRLKLHNKASDAVSY